MTGASQTKPTPVTGIRIPQPLIDNLKAIAKTKGARGYQTLIVDVLKQYCDDAKSDDDKREFKQIINGRVYNTSKAEFIQRKLINTFSYETNVLYRKHNGEYFIHVYELMGGRPEYIIPRGEEEFYHALSRFPNLPDSVISDFEDEGEE